MSEMELEGGCLCGAIRYRVTGPPRYTNVCYCKQCQRHTGAVMPAFAAYPLSHFTVIRGEPATYRSSSFAVRQFCPRCGSSLFWRDDVRDELDIYLGTLDDASGMPLPRDQLWTMHRLPWLFNVAEVQEYRESRE